MQRVHPLSRGGQAMEFEMTAKPLLAGLFSAIALVAFVWACVRIVRGRSIAAIAVAAAISDGAYLATAWASAHFEPAYLFAWVTLTAIVWLVLFAGRWTFRWVRARLRTAR